MIGPEISLADLLRVAAELGPAWIDRAASLLGLNPVTPSPAHSLRSPDVKPLPSKTLAERTKPMEESEPDTGRRIKKIPRSLTATSAMSETAAVPDWLNEPNREPVLLDTPVNIKYEPPFEPLFARHLRAILATALAVRRPDGPIDLHEVIDRRTCRRPPEPLPRLPQPSLRNGAQVLLDRRAAMMPFFKDQNRLVDTLRAVVGREACRIVQFFRTPHRIAPLGEMETDDYKLPPAGTPVLLVTDLGIGGARLQEIAVTTDEWIAFTERVRRASCPVIAFVPYRRSRWPQDLQRLITIIPWDRATTAGMVRCLTGPGLAVTR